MQAIPRSRLCLANGATFVEILFALTLGVALMTMAVPAVTGVLDDIRTGMAARYMAGRIGLIRLDAVRRSRSVALRFESAAGGYVFASFRDGNDNGVRSADIREGIDASLGPFERLSDKFSGVRFELADNAVDADGQAGTGPDGVRIGTARILTMSADGTATSGTLYIRGRRSQYAVRVLGVTGRTRLLQYQERNRTWMPR
jgi:hypothetical protein